MHKFLSAVLTAIALIFLCLQSCQNKGIQQIPLSSDADKCLQLLPPQDTFFVSIPAWGHENVLFHTCSVGNIGAAEMGHRGPVTFNCDSIKGYLTATTVLLGNTVYEEVPVFVGVDELGYDITVVKRHIYKTEDTQAQWLLVSTKFGVPHEKIPAKATAGW